MHYTQNLQDLFLTMHKYFTELTKDINDEIEGVTVRSLTELNTDAVITIAGMESYQTKSSKRNSNHTVSTSIRQD